MLFALTLVVFVEAVACRLLEVILLESSMVQMLLDESVVESSLMTMLLLFLVSS